MQFQPGRHISLSGSNVLASWLVFFTMNSEDSTEIDCNTYCRQYLITNVQNVHNIIRGIHFVRCGLQIESVMNFILEESSFSQVRDYDALYIRSFSAMIKWCNFTNNNNLPLYVDNSSTEVYTIVHLSAISVEEDTLVEEVY